MDSDKSFDHVRLDQLRHTRPKIKTKRTSCQTSALKLHLTKLHNHSNSHVFPVSGSVKPFVKQVWRPKNSLASTALSLPCVEKQKPLLSLKPVKTFVYSLSDCLMFKHCTHADSVLMFDDYKITRHASKLHKHSGCKYVKPIGPIFKWVPKGSLHA